MGFVQQMAEIKAMSDLLVEQRNEAWAENEKLKSRLAAIEGHLAKIKSAVEAELTDGSEIYRVEAGWDGCSCHGSQNYEYIEFDKFWAEVEKVMDR